MKIIHGLNNLKYPIKGSVVTVGVFDGVHIGHRKIIEKVVARTRELNLVSIVLTFDPHPLKVLKPEAEIPSLISLRHRLGIMESLGVDYCVILRFTKAISRLPPESFVKNILIDKLRMKEVYIGGNFFFGKGGAAGTASLKRMSRDYGFKTVSIRPVRLEGSVVSSTLIRTLIIKGDIIKASKLLGRRVSVLGTVVRGARRGRIMGFPTANIDPHHEAIPPSGVYAVKVKFEGRVYNGVLNIGVRPTFYHGRREATVEVHIFNFHRKIYGKDIETIFIRKLRGELKFKDRDELRDRIRSDAASACRILGCARLFSKMRFTKLGKCVNMTKSTAAI